MKLLFLTILAGLCFAPAFARAQTLHPTFSFSREPGDSGAIDYVLKPEVNEINKKFGEGNPFQIVGAVARVEAQRAVLLFANAQKESQLYSQKDKSVVITADATEIKNLEYQLPGKDSNSSPVNLEIANVLISFKDFQKIARANAVVVKFGAVTYKLDKDNLDALHYMAAEIDKDQQKKQK